MASCFSLPSSMPDHGDDMMILEEEHDDQDRGSSIQLQSCFQMNQSIHHHDHSQINSQMFQMPSSNVRRRRRSSLASARLICPNSSLSNSSSSHHHNIPERSHRSLRRCPTSIKTTTKSPRTSSSFSSSMLNSICNSSVVLLLLMVLFTVATSLEDHHQPQSQQTNSAVGSIDAKKEWSTGHHSVGRSASSASGVLVPRPRYRTLYACEGSSLEIVCEEGTHINLIRANFGRFSISVCNEHGNVEWSVDCMSHRSFRVIQDRCSGRSKCNLEASIATFGEDACPRVHKYLEVHFNCTAPRLPGQPSARPSIVQLMSNSNNNKAVANSQPQTATNSDNHNGDDSASSSSQSIAEASISNRNNHPISTATLSPVIIFPEPLSPSGGGQPEQPQHSVSTSTIIPPPRFVDLTPFDTKEAEEAAGAGMAGPSISGHYPDGSIIVRPPHPSDFDSNSDSMKPSMDEDEDEDDSDSEEIPIVIGPSGSHYSTSTTSSVLNNNPGSHHHYRPQVPPLHHSQVPTAKPPKPNQLDSELPSGEDGRVSFTSSSVNHHNGHDNDNDMVIEEEEVVVQPVMPSLDLLYNHCHAMFAKGINWNFTLAGSVAMQHCPGGAEGIARWSCIMEGAVPTWTPHLPDMSNCSSLWVTHLLSRIHSHRYPLLSLAEDLAKGAKGDILYSGDLIRAADIIKQLVMRLETLLEETKDDGQDRRAHIIKELLNSVLKVSSNLLEETKMESWHELSSQDQRLAIGSMTSALENVAQLLADVRTQSNYNYVRSHDNILVSVHVHPLSSLEHGMRLPWVLSQRESVNPSLTDAAPSEVSAYLPYESLVEHANDNGQVKVVFVLYRRLASLLKPRMPYLSDSPVHLQPYAYHHYSPQADPNNVDSFDPFVNSNQEQQPSSSQHHPSQSFGRSHSSVNTIVNSDVVGLIIASNQHHSSYDRLSTPLSAPLELTLRHLQIENVTNGRCAFWDIKRSDWSTSGCETVTSNQTHTVCRCNHLTNFAVLMDISNVSFDARNEFALKLITRIGCAISIVALLLTLITLSVYKSLNSIRNSIHKHLCGCLLVAEIIFLFGIDETRVKLVCGLIAIALHYFFLSAFLWMFFEGLQLYTMLVQVFEHRHNRLTFYSLVAYGAPALLVIVAALVDPLSYGTSDHCWLRTDNHFVWSFLGPALAVLLANALFLALAMSVMCRHAPTGMMNSASFAVHQKQQQQQQLKVYPSPLTSASSYSITDHSKLTSIRIWVRTSLALVVVLGLTWTFGVLYLSHSTVYMAYTFTILNSLQGLFIFIFCCLLNEKVRAEYRSTLARGARHCFLLRPFEPSSLAFATKSSTDSTRSTSLRDSHHLMMAAAASPHHHLSQQHLYMQQPAASFLGSRNAGPRTSLLYLNELLGKSEGPSAANTPTADQPLITSQMMQQTPQHMTQSQQHLPQQSLQQQQQQQQQSNMEPHQMSALQQAQLSQALSSLSQIALPDDASNSDYGCRRLTQMIEHIYECIDEDPYVAKLLLPAIQRSLANGGATQARAQGARPETGRASSQLPPSILATLGRASQRDHVNNNTSQMPMRLQPNSSYLSSGNHTLHGGAHINSLHLPAIVRDNTAIQNGLKNLQNGQQQGPINGMSLHHQQQQQQQQTVAMLDGDQVRCCTLTDHKLCDHQTELPNGIIVGGQPAMERSGHLMKSSRHHLASEC